MVLYFFVVLSAQVVIGEVFFAVNDMEFLDRNIEDLEELGLDRRAFRSEELADVFDHLRVLRC